jgi:WD40 repeat protein
VASGGGEGTVRLWNAAAAELEGVTYSGHTSQVNSVIELSDGRIASAGEDGVARIWSSDNL